MISNFLQLYISIFKASIKTFDKLHELLANITIKLGIIALSETWITQDTDYRLFNNRFKQHPNIESWFSINNVQPQDPKKAIDYDEADM